jgi:hypothetical protein
VFVWKVCLDVDGEAEPADNAFDLLPGIPHEIPWPPKQALPAVLTTGSRGLMPR